MPLIFAQSYSSHSYVSYKAFSLFTLEPKVHSMCIQCALGEFTSNVHWEILHPMCIGRFCIQCAKRIKSTSAYSSMCIQCALREFTSNVHWEILHPMCIGRFCIQCAKRIESTSAYRGGLKCIEHLYTYSTTPNHYPRGTCVHRLECTCALEL